MTRAALRTARRGRRLMLIAAVAVFVMAGCNLDVTVEADVEPDGSGLATVTVLFDEAAVAILDGDDLLTLVDTDDLAAAGWVVATPTLGGDGGVEFSATKQVANASQWQSVLDEIVGPDVFTDVRVIGTDERDERQRVLSFNIDLSQGPSLVFDDEVTAELDGEPLGQPLRQLTGGRPLDEAVTITVRAQVASSNADSTAGEWQPRFNQTTPLPVRLVSTTTSTASEVFRWIAGALASLGVLAALLAIVRTVLERRAAGLHTAQPQAESPSDSSARGRRRSSSEPGPFAAAAGVNEEQQQRDDAVRLVIVDPLTVLFQQSKPIDTYLLPYVRHNSGAAADEQILASHHQVVTGNIDTATMWQACGVDGEADLIDEVFCEMRWLRPGARDFLAEFSERRIPVAALTNDSAIWSNFVRQREHLTAVWPWLVSSDEGTIKPDPAIFEKLGRMIEVPWEQCLYVDTDPGALAAAQALGMRTTFFDPERKGADAALGHPRVENLEGFFRRQLN